MNNKSQNIRYYPHDLNTKFYATKLYKSGYPISLVCRRYKISKFSLLRWSKKFDVSIDSLRDKSHRPLSKHPNAHTDEEIKWIKDYTRRNPHITLPELYSKLRTEKGYSRHACSLFRVIRKMKAYLKRSNNIPMQVLNWMTPIEKREQLKSEANASL